MPLTVDDAVAHLYQVAVVEGKKQSPRRLDLLADFCIQELSERGVVGATTDIEIPGFGRTKKWDVVWNYDKKVRLGISLKSLLKNIPGTVPNRIDDLMGEVANIQLRSPEIVVGYIMIFHKDLADTESRKHGKTWIEVFRAGMDSLSNRRAPSWTPGTIEAYVVAEADFTDPPRLVSPRQDFDRFFDRLTEAVRERNPGA
ncbi:MAG: hypothetical protein OXH85_10075 [Truepera sp.]|nr:hypothetical protein [Truepera sp.]